MIENLNPFHTSRGQHLGQWDNLAFEVRTAVVYVQIEPLIDGDQQIGLTISVEITFRGCSGPAVD